MKLPERSFTDSYLKSIKPPERGQIVLTDGNTRGLHLRVSQGGTKTFYITYRKHGRIRWLRLGTYPPLSYASAREKAKTELAKAQLGGDPAGDQKRERDADTFEALAQKFLAEYPQNAKRHPLKPRTVAEYKRIIVALVARDRDRDPARAGQRTLQHHQRGTPLSVAVRGLDHKVDQQAVAVPHQRVAGVTEPCFPARAFARQPRFRIARRLMGRVTASLAMKVLGRITPIGRRAAWALIFTFEALERGPRLDQSAVDGEVLAREQPQRTRPLHYSEEELRCPPRVAAAVPDWC